MYISVCILIKMSTLVICLLIHEQENNIRVFWGVLKEQCSMEHLQHISESIYRIDFELASSLHFNGM